MDPKNISLYSCAKTNCSLQISKTVDEGAAWYLWWSTDDDVDQVIQDICTAAQAPSLRVSMGHVPWGEGISDGGVVAVGMVLVYASLVVICVFVWKDNYRMKPPERT